MFTYARLISEGIFRQDYDACLVSISLAMMSLSDQSVVVGGGFDGMSAANKVLLLLDNLLSAVVIQRRQQAESTERTQERSVRRASKIQQHFSRQTL